ncbi:unnamed protein product [Mytilus coruscus]|uniref:Reverse transcriptase domain-containing protein n=1 Tax=Mytilus coruscus TaxID=42192 RepID=A0A6J8CYE0_MYTCO|nr:unnamed protein product [Mytilus coruscus]
MNKATCLVNVYMPTKKSNSDVDYQAHLDILQAITNKYEDTHTIVFCGDMNGTLIKERNTSHDKKLAKFIKTNKLKLTGFKNKASLKVRQLIQTSKQKHREWDIAGRPRNNHILFVEKKSAKRDLRRQQRKEAAIEREQFLQRLEKDPNDKAFFQLIKRNQSNVKNNAPEILIDGVKTAKTPSSQRETFADCFKNLATPQENPNFKDELLTSRTNRCNLIKEVSKNITKKKILVTQQEILNAIQKLKNGKSPDEYGITAEHIKYAGNEITHIYQNIFNQIFGEGKVASRLKTGVITPVPKKGKDLTQATNYRGITVTSAHGKVYEYLVIEKAGLKNINQSNLQFGFTEGLSPTMGALISDKMNYCVNDMYNSVTSTVKWQGDTSLSFSIDQGVRQGEILSSHLYKQYINELLSELEAHNMGISIGNTYAGCPSCADDIVLLSNDQNEMQEMLNTDITSTKNTIYSLIKTGVHGTNGLNPRTSCKIYQVYVIPRLLYGLETLNLQNKDTIALCSFHLSTLKHIRQSLPNRTASSAVYLLLGTLPITAELHKRQLSLLHSIAMSHNNSIREIAWKQHTAGRPNNFFKRINDILNMYQIPSFNEIMNQHYNKLDWKNIVRTAIPSHIS